MSWIIAVREILNAEGLGTGRFRKTIYNKATNEGPWGDLSHDHSTVTEAEACEICNTFCAAIMDGKK